MDLTLILDLFLSGISTGMIYALLASGLALIFGLLGVINFAHYAFIAVGAYVGLEVIQSLGADFWVALVVAFVVVGLLGAVIERAVISRLYGESPVVSLIFTFGLAVAVVEILRVLKGTAFHHIAVPTALTGTITVPGATLPHYRLFLILISAALFLGVWLFLQKTTVGLIIRAAICDRGMTRALGIGVSRAFVITFGIGLALAGIAGLLIAPMTGIFPEMGAELLIIAFAVTIIGGMGSFMGALVAGLILGLISSFVTIFSPQLAMVSIFIFMVLFISFKPEGMFGEVGRVD